MRFLSDAATANYDIYMNSCIFKATVNGDLDSLLDPMALGGEQLYDRSKVHKAVDTLTDDCIAEYSEDDSVVFEDGDTKRYRNRPMSFVFFSLFLFLPLVVVMTILVALIWLWWSICVLAVGFAWTYTRTKVDDHKWKINTWHLNHSTTCSKNRQNYLLKGSLGYRSLSLLMFPKY